MWLQISPSSLPINTEEQNVDLVTGTLWQGGYPLFPPVNYGFHVLILCARERQLPPFDDAFDGVKIYRPSFHDAELMDEEMYRALGAALLVRKHLDFGHSVLSTCNAGWNRSGLVSAFALMLPRNRKSKYGTTPGSLTPEEAVRLVRRARGLDALTNPEFVDALRWIDSTKRDHTLWNKIWLNILKNADTLSQHP
jgi:hypothetical protein